jgi:putative copper resistance protein D
MLLAGLTQVYLTTATMIGSAAPDAVRSQITTVALETHAGKALLWNLFFLFILFLTLCIRRDWQRRATAWLLLTELVAVAVVRAGTGHAAANGDFTVSELVQFCHLISIAVWSGCVLAGGFLVLPGLLREQRAGDMTAFTRRLSRAVTFALVVVLLSGAYNSYVGLGGSFRPLAGTQWGVLLDIKLLLVLAAIAMGAANRRMLRGNRTLSVEQASALAATVRVEAIVMLAILTISAFLANSPPANPG